MALLHNTLKIYNTFLPFFDTLYILQLEEYSNKRLLHWLPRFFFKRNIQKRERLIITKKVLILTVLSHILFLISALLLLIITRGNLYTSAALIVAHILAVPFFVFCANAIFTVVELFPKKKQLARAAQKAKRVNPKTIVIAGSFGKTSTKNFVYQLSKSSFRTQMIPGNINTPMGIANWVLSSLLPTTELLIAEVDAYEVGEIKRSCLVIPADVALLTNIGDQHLERFKSKSELAQALSEVFSNSKPQSVKFCDKETINLIAPYYPEIKEIRVPEPLTNANMVSLSKSNQHNLRYAVSIAKELGVPEDILHSAVQNIELPERRQQITNLFGFEAIDDSYNISFTTATAGIKAAKELAQQKNKKLLVITAGIPELAKNEKDKNKELGVLLSSHADFTIILASMFAQEIAKGFSKMDHYAIVSTLTETIQSVLPTYNKDEWVLLLQPELNDLYY